MNITDLQEVLKIQNELAFQTWNESQFIAEINANYAYCIVYEESEIIKGYAIFHIMNSDSELLSIAVKNEFSRIGIGSALLNAGLSKLNFNNGDQCFLEVRESNKKARAFYEKQGFVSYGERKNYYANNETAILYKICQTF